MNEMKHKKGNHKVETFAWVHKAQVQGVSQTPLFIGSGELISSSFSLAGNLVSVDHFFDLWSFLKF